MKNEKHLIKKWIISFIILENTAGKIYKVTRTCPELFVSETLTFRSKEEAKRKFDEWLK